MTFSINPLFKAWVVILILSIFPTTTKAQSHRIDSVRNLLHSLDNPQKRAAAIHNIVLGATVINLDTAEKYTMMLIELGQGLDSGEYEAKGYKCLAEITRRKANYEQAISYAAKADSLAVTSEMKTKINNILGNIYFFKDDFTNASIYYQRALDMAVNGGVQDEIARNYNGLGMSYFRLGEYAEALKVNLRALNVVDSLDLDVRTGSIHGVIGVIYQNMNDYASAYEAYKKAIHADSVKEDPRGVITWKINWAIALENEGKYKEAEEIYLSSLADAKKYNFARLVSNVYCNMGALKSKAGDKKEAIVLFENSYRIADSIGATHLIAYDIQNLGSLHIANNNPKKAYKYLVRGRKMAHDLADPNFLKDIYLALADYYERVGRFDSALSNFQKYAIQKDSILNDSKLKEIGKVEAEYEYEKQRIIDEKEHEKQLEIERQKQQRQQLILIIGGISALIIFVLLVIIFRRLQVIRKQNKIIAEQKSEVESQSQKLKVLDMAKSNFFANISHDLRSPLTLILGSIDQVLEEEKTISLKSKDLLDSGYRNSKKLLFMTDEIRDLSRLQEGRLQLKKQYVKIDGYLNLLVKMFSSAAIYKKIVLEFDSKLEQSKIISLDPHQFEKVIYNLLSNAVRHTEELGSIKVSVEDLTSDSSKALITISDTGIGIPGDQIQHIFDRYYQVPTAIPGETSGFGIGLALCKEIVLLHDGEIWVESRENEGTTFSITLNYSPVDPSSKAIIDEYYDPILSPLEYAQPDEQSASVEQGKKTLLIVEDHREIRQYMSNLLKDLYNIVIAKNGEEALNQLKSHKIDLVISDLMMPYMDGFEFLKTIKADDQYRHLPVLIVSARTEEEDKLEILKLGAEEIIAKPFTPKELIIRTQNLLSKKGDHNVLDIFEPSNVNSGVENLISKKLESLILDRIDDPHLSVLDLSEAMAASERKVFRLVKKVFNLTPLELIKETRWKYLDALIQKGTKMSASEAGRCIGIGNVTYFKRQFKGRFGEDYEESIKSPK